MRGTNNCERCDGEGFVTEFINGMGVVRIVCTAHEEVDHCRLLRIEAAVDDVLKLGCIPEPITDFEEGYSNAMGLVQAKLRAAKEDK